MNLKIKLGKKVSELVEKKGQTLEQFAKENDISKGYMYDIGKGRGNVSLEVLEKLATGLKVEPKELLS